MRTLFALSLLALALAACDGGVEEITTCNLPDANGLAGVSPVSSEPLSVWAAPLALRVTVVDAATGQSLSPGAAGAFVVGTQADSLFHGEPDALHAWGPPGRYSVVVQHAGYAAWGRADVRVRGDECGGPVTQEVTARLQRTGP